MKFGTNFIALLSILEQNPTLTYLSTCRLESRIFGRESGPSFFTHCCGHPNGARLPLVHTQCWCKLLFDPFSPGSNFAQSTCKLPPNDNCATPQATGSQTGLSSQGYTHNANTHTLDAQRPQTRNRFPKGVFNNRTIQMIH